MCLYDGRGGVGVFRRKRVRAVGAVLDWEWESSEQRLDTTFARLRPSRPQAPDVKMPPRRSTCQQYQLDSNRASGRSMKGSEVEGRKGCVKTSRTR